MALFDVFRPKWKRDSWELRLEAVEEAEPTATEMFLELACNDRNIEVQMAALGRLDEVEDLQAVAKNCTNDEVVKGARYKLNEIFSKMLIDGEDDSLEFLPQISSDDFLIQVAWEAKSFDIRKSAIQEITDIGKLIHVTTKGCSKELGQVVLDEIEDVEALEKISTVASSKAVRKMAAVKLDGILNPPPTELELKEMKLKELIEDAEKRVNSFDFDRTQAWFSEKLVAFLELPEDSKTRIAFEQQQTLFAEHRALHEPAILQEKERLERKHDIVKQQRQVLDKMFDLDMTDEDLLTKFKELKSDLEALFAELPDVAEDITDGLCTIEAQVMNEIRVREIRDDELHKLEKACLKIESLVADEQDFSVLIDVTVNKSLPESELDAEEIKPFEDRYNAALVAIKERLKEHEAEIKQAEEAKLEKLKALIAQYQELTATDEIFKSIPQAKEIQKQWKELNGNNTEKEVFSNYVEVEKVFWNKVRESSVDNKWNEWYNRNSMKELIKRVEQTAEINDLYKVATIIQDAQNEWKTCGHVDKESRDELWNEFRAVCDKNYARCIEFFEAQRQQKAENAEKAREIIEKAKTLQDSEDWRTVSEELKQLQEEWKKVGMLPKEQNKPLYEEFRAACDYFFTRFKDHYHEVDEQRPENHQKKQELIDKLQAILDENDNLTPSDCMDLQKAWKEIGPAERGVEQVLWDKFRELCDEFFGRLDKDKEENLDFKLALCEEAEKLAEEALQAENLLDYTGKFKKLQKRWKSSGLVSKDKADEVWDRFRAPCDKFFAEVQKIYDAQAEVREENLTKKLAIIERAKEWSDSTEWREGAEALKALQAEWKEIGPVPREKDQETWHMFREACDAFFNRRKSFYNKMDSQRHDNQKEKEALLAELEQILNMSDKEPEVKDIKESKKQLSLSDELQLAFETNFAMASGGTSVKDEVRRIQQQWKQIGAAPRDVEQKLWDKFKGLLDSFYGNNKKEESNEAVVE